MTPGTNTDELRLLAASFRRGTSRSEVPAPGPGALGQATGQITRATPEETLLARAAVSGLYLQAGAAPLRSGEPAPVYTGEDPDDRPPVPPALLALLPAVQPYPALLHEWLALTSAVGFRLSAPQALPLLPLNDGGPGRLSRPLWTLLDPHARWLARLNPEWKKHDPATLPETVQLAGLRRELAEAHAAAPEASAADLLVRWPTFRAEERRTVLNVVAASLHVADRPLLELAQHDRLDDVRRRARLLSAHLPGELADAAWAALRAQLRLDAKGKLKYAPGDIPAVLQDPKPPKGAKPESDLALLVAATPLTVLAQWVQAQDTPGSAIGQLRSALAHRNIHTLDDAASGDLSLELLTEVGRTAQVLDGWPQGRLRARLHEALDRLLAGRPDAALDSSLLGLATLLLTRVEGALEDLNPAQPGPPDARLRQLFAQVLSDLSGPALNAQWAHLALLSALVMRLDPQPPLPALPPAVPGHKDGTPITETLGDPRRREALRQQLEQSYADLVHQHELRRQMHALLAESRMAR